MDVMMYQGIVVARDVHFGVVPVFYGAGHRNCYERDVVIGRLADNEAHEVLGSIWLERPVDYAAAQELADGIMAGVPDEPDGIMQEKYGFSMN